MILSFGFNCCLFFIFDIVIFFGCFSFVFYVFFGGVGRSGYEVLVRIRIRIRGLEEKGVSFVSIDL